MVRTALLFLRRKLKLLSIRNTSAPIVALNLRVSICLSCFAVNIDLTRIVYKFLKKFRNHPQKIYTCPPLIA